MSALFIQPPHRDLYLCFIDITLPLILLQGEFSANQTEDYQRINITIVLISETGYERIKVMNIRYITVKPHSPIGMVVAINGVERCENDITYF